MNAVVIRDVSDHSSSDVLSAFSRQHFVTSQGLSYEIVGKFFYSAISVFQKTFR